MQPVDRPVASPCNKTCTLDVRQVCVGCGRSIDEIVEWPQAGEGRRLEIVRLSRQRLAAGPGGGDQGSGAE